LGSARHGSFEAASELFLEFLQREAASPDAAKGRQREEATGINLEDPPVELFGLRSVNEDVIVRRDSVHRTSDGLILRKTKRDANKAKSEELQHI